MSLIGHSPPPKPKSPPRAGPSAPDHNTTFNIDLSNEPAPVKTSQTLSQTTKPKLKAPIGTPPPVVKYASRTLEARACLHKAKLNLNNSRNLKTEIKVETIAAIDRLYQLVKESEQCGPSQPAAAEIVSPPTPIITPIIDLEAGRREDELIKRLEEHTKLIKENTDRMEILKGKMEEHHAALQKPSYASVLTSDSKKTSTTLHSIVITSKNEKESGEQVLTQVRQAVNAKEGGVFVEKVRKGKDRKIILSCKSNDDRQTIKQRIIKAGNNLAVTDVQNKDPLLVLKDVLNYNTDEDILTALQRQNVDIFKGLDKNESRVEIRYRRKTRNPHTSHIVVKTSPTIWNRVMESGTVLIDMQRIRAEDQSPLTQCSMCLGYGHSRKFCKETKEVCSHCAGPHVRGDCPVQKQGIPPKCSNCASARLEHAEHNAFSENCPIRQRWDALARASVAYC